MQAADKQTELRKNQQWQRHHFLHLHAGTTPAAMREVSQVSTDNRRGEHRKADMQAASFLFLEVTKGRDKFDTTVPPAQTSPQCKHITTNTINFLQWPISARYCPTIASSGYSSSRCTRCGYNLFSNGKQFNIIGKSRESETNLQSKNRKNKERLQKNDVKIA